MKQQITLFTGLCSAVIFTLMTSATFAQDLIAHYKFDGDLSDEMENWDLVASPDFTPTFEMGFDGTANGAISGFTQEAYVETSGVFTPMTGDNGGASRTLIAWVYSTGSQDNNKNNMIVGMGDKFQDDGVTTVNAKKWTWGLVGNDQKLRIEVQGKGNTEGSNILLSSEDNKVWYQVAVTYNNSDGMMKMYLNGAEILSEDYSSISGAGLPLNTAASPLRVGNDFNNGRAAVPNRGYRYGAIDDLRVYNGVLSGTQIKDLYDNQLSLSNAVMASFKVYPNPVKQRLFFSTDDIKAVEIYNVLGAQVAKQKTVNRSVDMAALSQGAYFIKCFNGQGEAVSTIKAIKE